MAEQIIKEALAYYQSLRLRGKRPTYQDYEYYKQRLHDLGIYGEENRLAQALHL